MTCSLSIDETELLDAGGIPATLDESRAQQIDQRVSRSVLRTVNDIYRVTPMAGHAFLVRSMYAKS